MSTAAPTAAGLARPLHLWVFLARLLASLLFGVAKHLALLTVECFRRVARVTLDVFRFNEVLGFLVVGFRRSDVAFALIPSSRSSLIVGSSIFNF